MAEYKQGDKIIILDYNGKPLVPQVVARIEEIYPDGKYRLDLPDGAACFRMLSISRKLMRIPTQNT